MRNLQSYFSKFSKETCHWVPTIKKVHFLSNCMGKRPLSPKKDAKESTFPQNAHEKVHFFPKTHAKRSIFSQKMCEKVNFLPKSTPPNQDLATGLVSYCPVQEKIYWLHSPHSCVFRADLGLGWPGALSLWGAHTPRYRKKILQLCP